MTAAESRPALPEVLACLVDGDPRMAEFWRAATKPYDGDAKITLRVDATAEVLADLEREHAEVTRRLDLARVAVRSVARPVRR